MTKLFAGIFAGLTAVAGYTTANNIGVQESAFEAAKGPPSIRAASARTSRSRVGGSRRGSRGGK